jgi:hypothetical protein
MGNERRLKNIQRWMEAVPTVLESIKRMVAALEECLLRVGIFVLTMAALVTVVGHELSPVLRDISPAIRALVTFMADLWRRS